MELKHEQMKRPVPGCGCPACNAKRHAASKRRGRGTIMFAAQPTHLALGLAVASWITIFLLGLGLGAILWAG